MGWAVGKCGRRIGVAGTGVWRKTPHTENTDTPSIFLLTPINWYMDHTKWPEP